MFIGTLIGCFAAYPSVWALVFELRLAHRGAMAVEAMITLYPDALAFSHVSNATAWKAAFLNIGACRYRLNCNCLQRRRHPSRMHIIAPYTVVVQFSSRIFATRRCCTSGLYLTPLFGILRQQLLRSTLVKRNNAGKFILLITMFDIIVASVLPLTNDGNPSRSRLQQRVPLLHKHVRPRAGARPVGMVPLPNDPLPTWWRNQCRPS